MITIHNKSFKPYIKSNDILQSVEKIAATINLDYADKNPIIIGILNGAFMFMADLAKHLKIKCEITFIRLSSYSGVSSSGEVNQLVGFKENVEGRHVIIVEDIVDSGTTFSVFLPQLKKGGPLSIKIAALLLKPESNVHNIGVDYLGFEIEDKFVVGYGLDYNGQGRNLNDIYQLVE